MKLSNEDAKGVRDILTRESRIKALLLDAKDFVQGADHDDRCPRNRDDFDCTCGKDELESRLLSMVDEL